MYSALETGSRVAPCVGPMRSGHLPPTAPARPAERQDAMSDDGLADLRALANESGHLFAPLDPVQSVVVYVPMRATDELGNAAHLFETDDKGIPRFMRLGQYDRRIVYCAYSPVVWIENRRVAPHQLRFYLVGADQRASEDADRRARLFDGLAERCCSTACPTEETPAGPSEPPSYPAFEPYRVARWTYWLHVHAWHRVIGSLVAPRRTALLGTDQRFGPVWFPVETSIASGSAEPTKADELDLERGWFSHLTTDVFEATRLVLERLIGNLERHSDKAERVQKRPMKAEEARSKAEAIVNRDGWPVNRGKPSKRRLAEKIGCHPGTLDKAIKESAKLRRAYLRAGGHLGGAGANDEVSLLTAEQTLDAKSRHA